MDKASVTRLVTLLTSLLAYFGVHIPQSWQDWTVGLIMLVVMAWGFWKNNSFTKEAIEADKQLKKAKQEKKAAQN